jgi:hypothetical protein
MYFIYGVWGGRGKWWRVEEMERRLTVLPAGECSV